MLITNQSNTYLLKRMNSFETAVTPVRRNVARKSTANRPLFNTIIKHSFDSDKLNDFTSTETISEAYNCSNYPMYKSPDFSLYFQNDTKSTMKRSILNIKENLNEPQQTNNLIDNSENVILSEDEEDESSGIFCVSDAMVKYLDDGILSPSITCDSSDESIDLTRVKNYPVKLEKCQNEPTTEFFISSKDLSPLKESTQNKGLSFKQKMLAGSNEHIIFNNDSIISDNGNITELGIQTKKCLFDPNLKSVTCKVKVREEVLVCENVPLKMTILEANFDAEQLENKVEEINFNADIIDVKDEDSDIPQLMYAVSLGSGESNMDEAISVDDFDKEKKANSTNKKESFKSSEVKLDMSSEVNTKRMTRSQMQVCNNISKRITRNRVKRDSLSLTGGVIDVGHSNNLCNDDDVKPVLSNDSLNKKSQPPNVEEKVDDISNEDKSDCKKKCILDKKGKKEINEGVLLHVEASKETELMRDGKIVKEKEEYLKDIESKIDKNLPVVVEKEFDIQQSLTEEILLDQVLRSANQRTSPRLSKIMKEALLKASVKKTGSKTKQQKLNSSKVELKTKVDKPLLQKCSEDSETSHLTLNNSITSESATDVSCNSDTSHSTEMQNDANENLNQKKNKGKYVVTPVINQTSAEKVVEPLTIKICRKNNKKKSGFRLSLKKKKSPKKTTGVTKPLCSNAVNMDDLSKTFEDILQDDNWCSDGKVDNVNEEKFINHEETTLKSLDPNLSYKGGPSSEDLSDKTNVDNLDTEICEAVGNKSITEKHVNNMNEKNSNDQIRTQNKCSEKLFNTEITVKSPDSKNVCELKADGEDESSLNNSISFLSENDVHTKNKNNLLDKNLLSTLSTDINEFKNENNTKRNDETQTDIDLRLFPTSHSTDNSLTVSNSDVKNTELSNIEPHPAVTSVLSHTGTQPQNLLNGSPERNVHSSPNDMPTKPIFSTNIVTIKHNQQINTTSDVDNSQVIGLKMQTQQEQAVEQRTLSITTSTPSIDLPPKIVPLSIASRDPRLRKSHVRLILDVNTSSVSNSLSDRPEIRQETRIISHVIENYSGDIDLRRGSGMESFTKDIDERKKSAMENFSNEIENSRDNILDKFSRDIDAKRDVDSDPELIENIVEMERKKKFRKKEVDAELLYKTPLSDLHDVPERSSYNRSIRKKSPPKNDKRDPRSSRWKESNVSTNPDRPTEPYREYHEINMVYSRITLDSVRRETLNSEDYIRNDGFSSDYRKERFRPEPPHQPEHYSSHRNDEFQPDLRGREFYQNKSTEFIHEVRRTKEFSERHLGQQNQSDHRRLSYHSKDSHHEYRHSENYPPEYMPLENNYSRGYKRSNDFCVDQVRRESPDFREMDLVRERNHNSHNEPSYSRWDYAHKRVEGHFPPDVDDDSKKEEENSRPDEIANMWEEERDLIDGPVKNFTKPFYRRKKFSRGEELFERRNAPWDIENRRYPEDSDRTHERLWVRKTDQELIHGPERDRWERRNRKGFREDRSRSPRGDHDRYPGKLSRPPGNCLKSRREASPSPHNSPLVLDSPMSPEPADRYSVLEPTMCLNIPQ